MTADLCSHGWQPSEPLWRRAPSRDADGRLLGDFMMLIPQLAGASELRRERIFIELKGVFRKFRNDVRFADLNLRLSLLWVSVDASPGIIREIVVAIRERIPEAVLVAQECGGLGPEPRPRSDPAGLLSRIGDLWRRRVSHRRLGTLAPPDRSGD